VENGKDKKYSIRTYSVGYMNINFYYPRVENLSAFAAKGTFIALTSKKLHNRFTVA
jgi:hypothetical protein